MQNLSNLTEIVCLVSAIALAACSTRAPEAASSAHGSSTTRTVESAILPGSAKDFQTNVGDTVHFDYDRYAITDEDRGTLQRQAAWLQKYPRVAVMIEGHCDERGTRVYNLALGGRRAFAVKEYLVGLGVSSSRLETISYGKERPICTDSTESCWAQNRRGVTTIRNGATSS
jgi:peptidoglycan-associated lipoprotein